MNIWTLGVVGEPDIIRDVRLRNHLSFVGPAGFAHPDDFEIFDLQRQAYHTTPHKWLDYSKGMRTDAVKDNDGARRKANCSTNHNSVRGGPSGTVSSPAPKPWKDEGTEMEAMLLKNKVESFLYDEASLLDNWRLQEWEALFLTMASISYRPLAYDGAETADPRKVMFIIDDNRETITARTRRMLRKDAYVESPRSRIRHAVSNVRVLSDKGDTVRASANVAVYRARRGQVSLYIGEAFYIWCVTAITSGFAKSASVSTTTCCNHRAVSPSSLILTFQGWPAATSDAALHPCGTSNKPAFGRRIPCRCRGMSDNRAQFITVRVSGLSS